MSLPRVDLSIWAEELYASCPGIVKDALNKTIVSALREFCVQSGAYIVPLWAHNPSTYTYDKLLPVPIFIGQNEDQLSYIFNIDGEIKKFEHDALTFEGSDIPVCQDYGLHNVLYVHRIAYYSDFHYVNFQGKRVEVTSAYSSVEESEYNPPLAPCKPDVWLRPITEYAMRDHSEDASKKPIYFSSNNTFPGTVEITGLTNELNEGNTSDPDATKKQGFVPWVSLGFPHNIHENTRDSIPEIFSRYWYDVILSGSMARLMRMPNKPFSNFKQSVFHQREFRSGIAQARDEGRRRFLGATDPHLFPPWT